MKCEIDDARMFLQIVRECKDPLAILREALSNSYDAGATRARIVLRRRNGKGVDIEAHDNGSGIRPSEFRYFFGLGFGNKDGKPLIGNKGLGSKLFFNSERIDVTTRLKAGVCYEAILNAPMETLEALLVPNYELRRRKSVAVHYSRGTSIRIRGFRANPRSPLLTPENVVSYVKWFTAAGSCQRLFARTRGRPFVVDVEVGSTPRTRHRITGHELPGHNAPRNDRHRDFAQAFEPFRVPLQDDDGRRLGLLEVAGAIVGPGGHLVTDRRIKKRFKGVFLARDYFIVRNVSEEVFGGTGEWQSTHIIANCQELKLAVTRDDFIDTGPYEVYAETIAALRAFANALRRGERFTYRGRTIETGLVFAGRCYSRLKSLRNAELVEERTQRRALDLLVLGERPATPLTGDGGPLVAPRDPIGVLLTFQALVAKGYKFGLANKTSAERYEFRVVGYSGSAEGCLIVQRRNGKRWSEPLFYRPIVDFANMGSGEDFDGVICWASPSALPSEAGMLDTVVLSEVATGPTPKERTFAGS